MAFCKNCGAQVPDGTNVCPNCGTTMQAAAGFTPDYQPTYTPQPVVQGNSTPIFVFGLLSVILGGVIGIIFSCVSKSKLKAWVAEGNPVTGKAKAGQILATIGLITSIISLIVIVIYAIIIIAGGAAIASSYNW